MNTYTVITLFFWFVLFIYWGINAQKVKSAVQKQSRFSRYLYLFLFFSGWFIIYSPYCAVGILGYQLIPASAASGIAGVIISACGVAFAIWARKTLGANWSGDVTLKKEHELIQSGPYQFVRHPIYTSFEIGLLGVAITVGQLKGLVGLSLVFACHYYKSAMEEKIMYQQFGDRYDDYAKRVKRLVPFVF